MNSQFGEQQKNRLLVFQQMINYTVTYSKHKHTDWSGLQHSDFPDYVRAPIHFRGIFHEKF